MAGGSTEPSGLTKRFSEVAVDNIDLTVASGEFFSLLGPLIPNEGDETSALAQGTPVHVYLPPDALRVLTGATAGTPAAAAAAAALVAS